MIRAWYRARKARRAAEILARFDQETDDALRMKRIIFRDPEPGFGYDALKRFNDRQIETARAMRAERRRKLCRELGVQA